MKGKIQDIHELTRIEAYLLSEKAGHPSHMHDYFWTQAEAIVRQRVAIVAVAVKASGKKSEKSSSGKPADNSKTASPKKKSSVTTARKTAEPELLLTEEHAKAKSTKAKAAAPAAKKIDAKKGKSPSKSAPKSK